MSADKRTKRAVPRRRAAKSTLGGDLLTSMEQALAYAKGDRVAARVTTVMVPSVDVKAIRGRLGLSQAKFAAKFGFAPASIRNWEQGRRFPDGPARILLAVIGERPDVIESVLRRTA